MRNIDACVSRFVARNLGYIRQRLRSLWKFVTGNDEGAATETYHKVVAQFPFFQSFTVKY